MVLMACTVKGHTKGAGKASNSPLRIFPKLNIEVEVTDRATSHPVRVTGRADWGIGYADRRGAGEGTVIAVVEAKKRSTFSAGESQLLA